MKTNDIKLSVKDIEKVAGGGPTITASRSTPDIDFGCGSIGRGRPTSPLGGRHFGEYVYSNPDALK